MSRSVKAQKNTVQLLVPSLGVLTLLSGCGNYFNNSDISPFSRPKIIVPVLAAELTPLETLQIRFDHALLEQARVQGGEDFRRAFGGSDAEAVSRWVAARVTRVASGSALFEGSKIPSGTVAANLGFALYVQGVISGSFVEWIWTQGGTMVADSPSNGLIALFNAASHGNATRAATWVHEARHGDCPVGLSKESAQRISTNKGESDPAIDRRCGYLHVTCPENHPLHGEAACDGVDEGAYLYGLYWARTIRDSCENCDETLKEAAEAFAIESASRVLQEDPT